MICRFCKKRPYAAAIAILSLFSMPLAAQIDSQDLAKQIAEMNATIQKLQHRVDELEAKLGSTAAAERLGVQQAARPALPPSGQVVPEQPTPSNFLRGTSLNFLIDGYYQYDFNNPIGRVNLLRA